MSLLDCSDEFERLLNIVNSSLAESFKHNFHQVVDDIIELARENNKKQIKEFLGFHTIRIGSTPTFLYFDLYLYSAYAAHYVYVNIVC